MWGYRLPALKPKNESGNPFGRPKGSRNKLAEAFIADVYADWLEHGILALVRVREKQPAAYLRVVASLLPQHVEVSDDVGLLSDDELDARIKLIDATIAGASWSSDRTA